MYTPFTIPNWYQEVKIWAKDKRCSSRLWIPWKNKHEQRTQRSCDSQPGITAFCTVHCIQHGRIITTRCIGSASELLNGKDWSSIKHDRTQSSFTTRSQLMVSRRQKWWKLEKSKTRKYVRRLDLLQRFPLKTIGLFINFKGGIRLLPVPHGGSGMNLLWTNRLQLMAICCNRRSGWTKREMHVRDSVRNRMAKHSSRDEGCSCLELVDSKNDFSTFKLCNRESILRELKIECLHMGWKIVFSCCKILNGLETSKIVQAILEPQKHLAVVRILLFLVQSWWWLMTTTKRILRCLVWSERGCRRSSPPQATTYVKERAVRLRRTVHRSSQYYVTGTGAANTWKTCAVTATITTW